MDVPMLVQQYNEYVTSSGERWTWINVPRFRRTEYSLANQYVSTYGGVMNNGGDVVYAVNDYCRVSVPTLGEHETSVGHSTSFNLHTVVCYTFCGEPPTPCHTVDHVDRCHWNNFYKNLRWASPEEQLNNREITQFVVDYQGKVVTNLRALSSITGKRPSYLRGLIKQGCNELFTVVKKARYPVQPVTSVRHVERARKNTHRQVFDYFVTCKMTVGEISERTGLQPSTVQSYVVKGAKEASVEQRLSFGRRIGLCEQDTVKRLEALVGEFKATNPSRDDWERDGPVLYTRLLSSASPPLTGDEYRIVQGTYKMLRMD